MNIQNTLHYAGYLKWIFLIATVILMLYAFIYMPDNLISVIGIIIFLIGIYMGLDSLNTTEKMSEKEKNFYRSKKLVKVQSTILVSGIFTTIIISLFFLSLKFIFPTKSTTLFNELFNLGLDCWAMVLGLFCMLKSTFDKRNFAND